MTRKDYKLIAKVMFEAKPTDSYPDKPIDVWVDAMRGLLTELARDNPAFNRSKFIAAANGK